LLCKEVALGAVQRIGLWSVGGKRGWGEGGKRGMLDGLRKSMVIEAGEQWERRSVWLV
jgi:hypothetical protein